MTLRSTYSLARVGLESRNTSRELGRGLARVESCMTSTTTSEDSCERCCKSQESVSRESSLARPLPSSREVLRPLPIRARGNARLNSLTTPRLSQDLYRVRERCCVTRDRLSQDYTLIERNPPLLDSRKTSTEFVRDVARLCVA